VTGSRPRRGRRTVANGSATAAGLRRDAGRADLRPPPRPGFGLPSDRRASRRRQPSSSSPSRCESVVMNDHPTHRHRWLDGGVPHEASFVGTPGGPGRTRSRGAGFLLCTPRSRLRGDPIAPREAGFAGTPPPAPSGQERGRGRFGSGSRPGRAEGKRALRTARPPGSSPGVPVSGVRASRRGERGRGRPRPPRHPRPSLQGPQQDRDPLRGPPARSPGRRGATGRRSPPAGPDPPPTP
jgi:hypothetical protein